MKLWKIMYFAVDKIDLNQSKYAKGHLLATMPERDKRTWSFKEPSSLFGYCKELWVESNCGDEPQYIPKRLWPDKSMTWESDPVEVKVYLDI